MEPYYQDDQVTLYHGDCLTITEWVSADLLLTDPPYGKDQKQGNLHPESYRKHNDASAIHGDKDCMVRDAMLALWGDRRAIVFGDLRLPPAGAKQVLVYAKPDDAGVRGATAGFRRDAEGISLLGPWSSSIGGRSSVLRTRVSMVSGAQGLSASSGHRMAKPLDVLTELLRAVPDAQVVADPFAGTGSVLLAARAMGLRAIGVEIEEKYAKRAANRLSTPIAPWGVVS